MFSFRIANFVRQSFRRSMRRIAAASIFQSANQTEELSRPPEYTPSVTIELHHSLSAEVPTVPQQISAPSAVDGEEVPALLLAQSYGERSQTLPSRGKQLTAPEVAKILRGSFRRSQRYRNHNLPQWIRQDDKPVQQTDENNASWFLQLNFVLALIIIFHLKWDCNLNKLLCLRY